MECVAGGYLGVSSRSGLTGAGGMGERRRVCRDGRTQKWKSTIFKLSKAQVQGSLILNWIIVVLLWPRYEFFIWLHKAERRETNELPSLRLDSTRRYLTVMWDTKRIVLSANDLLRSHGNCDNFTRLESISTFLCWFDLITILYGVSSLREFIKYS